MRLLNLWEVQHRTSANLSIKALSVGDQNHEIEWNWYLEKKSTTMKPHPFISCCFRNFWMYPLSKSQDDTKEQSEKAKRSQAIPDSTSHVPKRQNQSTTTEACNPTRLFGHWNWFKTQISSNTLRPDGRLILVQHSKSHKHIYPRCKGRATEVHPSRVPICKIVSIEREMLPPGEGYLPVNKATGFNK